MLPAGTLQNVTAYAAQIALIAVLAALILRVVPGVAAGFRYAYWRLVLAAALVGPWILRPAPSAPETAAVESGGTVPRAIPFIETSSPVPALTDGGIPWLALAPWILAAGITMRLLWVAIGIARL